MDGPPHHDRSPRYEGRALPPGVGGVRRELGHFCVVVVVGDYRGVGRNPDETAGPYPGDGSNGPDVLEQSGIVRRDIRSSFEEYSGTAEGVPMTLELVPSAPEESLDRIGRIASVRRAGGGSRTPTPEGTRS
jgi:hypothetical protein